MLSKRVTFAAFRKGGLIHKVVNAGPSTYAIRWHEQVNHQGNGSKTRPAIQQQCKNQTANSSETRPVEQFKNQTEEMPLKNNTNKQQDVFSDSVVAVENLGITQLTTTSRV